MVLICNNNILTIDQFHKNRCAEKNEIKNIILNFKKIKEKYKETTPKEAEAEPNTSYIETAEGLQPNKTVSIYLTKPNSTRK